jgi:hypothetical protein
MKIYNCEKCNKVFKQKSHYDVHINKKNPCNNISIFSNTINNTQNLPKNTQNLPKNTQKLPKNTKFTELSLDLYNNYTDRDILNKQIIINSESMKQYIDEKKCIYCNKEFSRKENIFNHIKYSCKKKKEIEKEKDNIFNELKVLKEKNDTLEKQNEKLINKMNKIENLLMKNNSNNSGNIINNDNSNIINTTNIGQQNFNLINYNKENLSLINRKKFLTAVKKGYNTPIEVTRAIHFNEDHPEYHNIYIPRINEKHAMVYKNNQWRLMDKDELIDDLHDQKKAFVEDNFDEFYNSLDYLKQKSLLRWMNSDDDEICIKNTKEGLKNLLFENKEMVLEYKKEYRKKSKSISICKNK